MRKEQIIHLVIYILCALIYMFIFIDKNVGLNLVIFETLITTLLFIIHKPIKSGVYKTTTGIFVLTALIISLISVVFVHNSWSFFVNYLFLFANSILVINKGYRAFPYLMLDSVYKIVLSFDLHNDNKKFTKEKKIFILNRILYYVIIPIVFLIIFLFLYVNASYNFYSIIDPLLQRLTLPDNFYRYTLVFIFGFICTIVLLRKTDYDFMKSRDLTGVNYLVREKQKKLFFNFNGLNMQLKAGVILFLTLNLLILFFNITDILYVWNFTWDNALLKEFVHDGTWLLVASIIIATCIVLYFFKRNLNFHKKNKLLKTLAVIWICQNIFMTLSVFVRNYWYIQYYGLAYKRIGVVFFLILTLFGLITILIKVINRKTFFYLLRVNGYAFILVLLISSVIPWNIVIAKYNFKHSNRSFVEYVYMARLHSNAIPYLIKSDDELDKIEKYQKAKFNFIIKKGNDYTTDEFKERIQERKKNFIKSYKEKNLLEWNYADYRTYKKLINN